MKLKPLPQPDPVQYVYIGGEPYVEELARFERELVNGKPDTFEVTGLAAYLRGQPKKLRQGDRKAELRRRGR